MAKRKARKRREQQREPGRKLKSHLRALGLSSTKELRSNRELVAEGKALNHCVSSYAKNCRKGNISVWSLRAVIGDIHEPVLTVAVDNMSRRVTQVRGKFNISVSGKRRNKKHNTLKQSYLRLIPRSQTILQKWMRKEGLTSSY